MTIRRMWNRLALLLSRRDVDREMHDEMRFHVDMEAADLAASGLEESEARRRAFARFGGVPRYQDEGRDARGLRWIRDFQSDLRYALRSLGRGPVFAATAVLTLAIGIGASSTIFGFADTLIFRPLPFPDGDRLMVLYDEQQPGDEFPTSLLEFKDWKAGLQSADAMIASFTIGATYTSGETAERVIVGLASEGYFEVLGVEVAAGRRFGAADHLAGAAPAALVSVPFWRAFLGGRSDAVGQSIMLDGKSYTVAGVVGRGLEFQTRATQVWLPLEPNAPWTDRGSHYLGVVGRMRAGVSLEAFRADAASLVRRLNAEPGTSHDIRVRPLRDAMVGQGRSPVLMLFAAVGFVLLIAMANLAGLLQARASARGREYAVRAALGAGRGRLVRQTIAEVLVLAGLGAAAGIALAFGALKLLLGLWPPTLPLPVEVRVDGRVLAFAVAASLVAGVLAALSPELLRLHGDALRSRGGSFLRRGVRRWLVSAEVALTLVLLVGAGLTLRSLERVLSMDPGFVAEGVTVYRVNLPRARYPQDWNRRAFFDALLERTRAGQGVRTAGAVLNLPLGGGGMNGDMAVEGRTFADGEEPRAEKQIVTPGYFETMGIRVLQGRGFTAQDRDSAPQVAVINESLAKKLWPGGNALGARVRILGDSTTWQEVVGVVQDVRLDGLDLAPRYESYLAFAQYPQQAMTIVARHGGPSEAVLAAGRAAVREMDRQLPVTAAQTLSQVVSRSVSARRMPAMLLAGFAGIALLLAAVGLYGLLAFSVSQRTREIGVRMALGAEQGMVAREVLGEGMRLVVLGAVIGLALSLALSGVVRRLLYQVAPLDLLTYATAAAALVGVAAAACWIPARRAARVDPVRALGSD